MKQLDEVEVLDQTQNLGNKDDITTSFFERKLEENDLRCLKINTKELGMIFNRLVHKLAMLEASKCQKAEFLKLVPAEALDSENSS